MTSSRGDIVILRSRVPDGHERTAHFGEKRREEPDVTQAAEERPDKVQTLVYLAAFLIPNGATILPLALTHSDSLIVPNLDVDQEAGWDMLRPEAFRTALYADCSEDDVALASALLTPEPSGPTNTPIRTTDERFGRIPRVYIELLQDRAVSPAAQKKTRFRHHATITVIRARRQDQESQGSITLMPQWSKSPMLRVAIAAPAARAIPAICASNWEMDRPVRRRSTAMRA